MVYTVDVVDVVTSAPSVLLAEGFQPNPALAVPVICPDAGGLGNWVGGPTAVLDDDAIILGYRMRRPVGAGRGHAVVIARATDGQRFEPILTIASDEMDAESLERPMLAVTEDGTWRLYLSCATWDTRHWRVEVLEAKAPDLFDPRQRQVLLPGDASRAVKDPVIQWHDGSWHMWACIHPLDDPAQTDRMWTEYAVSADGLEWAWQGPALTPRSDEWDARGTRVTAVRFLPDGVLAYYDGRASAGENFEERTGLAFGQQPGQLNAVGTGPAAQSPHPPHGLRYLSRLVLPDGRERFYYELTRADGAHDLCTELRVRQG
jgi:hypothetical protein